MRKTESEQVMWAVYRTEKGVGGRVNTYKVKHILTVPYALLSQRAGDAQMWIKGGVSPELMHKFLSESFHTVSSSETNHFQLL